MLVSLGQEKEARTLMPAPLLPNAVKGEIQEAAEDDGLKTSPELIQTQRLLSTRPIQRGTWEVKQLKTKRREELRKMTSSRLQEIHPWSIVHPDCLLLWMCAWVPGVAESPSSGDPVLILPPVKSLDTRGRWWPMAAEAGPGTQMGVAGR